MTMIWLARRENAFHGLRATLLKFSPADQKWVLTRLLREPTIRL